MREAALLEAGGSLTTHRSTTRQAVSSTAPSVEEKILNAEQIEQWLAVRLAGTLKVSPGEVDRHRAIDEYGLDSMEIVGLTGELEDLLGVRIEPTVVWDQRTIHRMAAYLASSALPTSSDGMSDEEVARMLSLLEGGER